jgi:glycosyltransferase involved in cell wall biosynthesis
VTSALRCLYFTPLKPPDHPTPSGDRLIAGLFGNLLSRLGYEVLQASRLRTRCASPDELPGIVAAAEAEVARILTGEAGTATPPALVFTYHNYYKAPDLIGPRVAQALGIPYVIAEASRAPRRADGPFDAAHRRAEAATDAADLILSPTQHDMVALEAGRREGQHIVHLPPFLDLADWPLALTPRPRRAPGPVRLLTVAMMRTGYKFASYLALAETLMHLRHLDWTLDIVGDGEMQPDVQAAFGGFGSRVRLLGRIQSADVMAGLYRQADLFVWPAIDEPFGMVFLEAQAHGTPCIAHGYRGVPDVIADEISGIVVPPGNKARFEAQLRRLIQEEALRNGFSHGAMAKVTTHHGMDAAAARVGTAFAEAGVPLP